MNKNLFFDKPIDADQLPTTPKKKSQFQQESINTTPKIKYRYTIVEKPANSWMGKVFFLIWFSLLIGSIFISYQSKMYSLQNSIKQEMSKCQKDFINNKCQTPLKGIKQFCQQKRKCSQANLQQLLTIRTQGTLFFGQFISEFFQGLGIPLTLIGLVYLIFGGKKTNEVKKEFVEYYP